MALRVDSDFIVGGAARDPLSPNFRYGEFRSVTDAGAPRVHLDLVSGLQQLRERLGAGVSVQGVDADGAPAGAVSGLFAWVSAAEMDALEGAARDLMASGWFSDVARAGDRLYVAVAPAQAPAIDANTSLDASVRVTSAFETSGDPYQQVTGNFDGAGLSFGPAQINFGTGTLPPVFEEMRRADEDALRECFGSDYDRWLDVLAAPRQQQLAWADGLSRGSTKAGFAQPWKGYLQAVGRVPAFQVVLVESAKSKYGAKMRRALGQLRDLAPDIVIDRQNCIAAIYDLCTQQGSLDKALDTIATRIAAERPEEQRALVRIAVFERGATARSEYRADCISRRLGILDRIPVRVEHSGKVVTRQNRNFWLVRGVPVAGLDSL